MRRRRINCINAIGPQPEVCDGKDNDCDEKAITTSMGVGTVCGNDVGECKKGTIACVLLPSGDWGASIAAIIMEPVPCNYGLILPKEDYLLRVQEPVRPVRNSTDIRRGHYRVPSRSRRCAGILRDQCRHHYPGEDNRRRSSGRRLWRLKKDHENDIAPRRRVPGRYAFR